MTSKEFREKIKGRIPAKYVYISKNLYTIKGIPMYLVSYNSRIPNTKISKSVIHHQSILKVQGIIGDSLSSIKFTPPMLIEEYSREVRTNSIILFVDIAGSHLSRENYL